MTLRELVSEAVDELRQWRDEHPGDDEPHDAIHEIADQAVPITTFELLKLAIENIALAVDTPECGPAFDGEPTPVNIIGANVYEYLEVALWEAWQAMLDEEDEEEDDDAA